MKGARWVVAAAAGAALVLLLVLLSREGEAQKTPPPVVAEAPVAGPPRNPWCRDGQERRYGLAHQSRSHAAVAGAAQQALQVDTTLEGVLVTRCEDGAALGQTRVGFRLESLDNASVTALAQPVLTEAERTALLGLTMFLDMDAHGTVHALRFSEPNTNLAQNIMQWILGDIQVQVRNEPAYEQVEEAINGSVKSQYRRSGSGREQVLERQRATYASLRAAEAYGQPLPYTLKGDARVRLEDGLVADLASEESLQVGGPGVGGPQLQGRAVTTLKFLAHRPVQGGPVVRVGAPVTPGQLAVHADFADRTLAMRVEGLTGDQLKELLLKFANGGMVPDHNRFLWRATGLLRAKPELCDALANLFQDAHFNERGRQLIVDLLVGAGTGPAQAALRKALTSKAAVDDQHYGMLYQRLGLLSAPDQSTVDMARERYVAPGPEGKGAAIYAYGAVLGNRLAMGDSGAKGLANAILQDLQAARSPSDQALLLTALGNAGVPEQTQAITSFTTSSEPEVRRAAANALRKAKDDATTATLVQMVGDPHVDVQRRALMSLQGRTLDGAAWTAITGVVAAGRLGTASYDLLLDLASSSLHLAETRAMLEAVIQLDVDNIHVMGRAREMLAPFQTVPTAPEPDDLDEEENAQ
ncbi:MAG: HEAT repeat domain-containing protein [Myxococcota bacterium]